MAQRFEIVDTITRVYRRYNAVGRKLNVRLTRTSHNRNSVAHSLASVNDVFENALSDVDDTYMVVVRVENEVNQNEKPVGISFRWKDQLSGDVL